MTVNGILRICSPAVLAALSIVAVGATPPASHTTASAAAVQAQLEDVDAQITAARTQQARLQSQVTQMEQQNAARKQQLQQRDATIAALQKKLAAAGVPAASATAGH